MPRYKIVMPSSARDDNGLYLRFKQAQEMTARGYRIRETGQKHTWEVIAPSGKIYQVSYNGKQLCCPCLDTRLFSAAEANGWCRHKIFVLINANIPEIMVASLLVDPSLTQYLKKTGRD